MVHPVFMNVTAVSAATRMCRTVASAGRAMVFSCLAAMFVTATIPAQDWRSMEWENVAPGVWSARVGTPESIDLLKAAGARPRIDGLEAMGTPVQPPATGLSRHLATGTKTYLRFPLGPSDDIYGLGLDFKRVRQTETIQTLQVDHWGGTPGRTHAPVPFFVSTAGYGVLVNSARYVKFYLGTGVRKDSPSPPDVRDRNSDPDWDSSPRGDSVEVLIPSTGVEVYLFAGPDLLDIVRRFNLFCGGGVLPPKWGLGFTHRTPTLFDADQLLAEVDEFARRGFPLDFVGLEPGWHSHAYPCSFTWDSSRFPDPGQFIQAMKERGIRLNLWMNPYVAPTSPLHEKLKPFSGSHLVWNGIVPDYRLPAAVSLFRNHIEKELLSLGVSGFKIDEVDGFDKWLWPDLATFPSGIDGEQMRQIYGLLLQRLTEEAFRDRNQRTYGLVRGSNAGGVRFPYVIYNDHYSHQDFIRALINSSFAGVLWTPEVRSSKSAEEWLRRMQTVCFSPMAMLNAWSSGTKPWSFPEVEAAVREVANLRMQLLPYLYSTFARYYRDGTPPVRAMQLLPGFVSPAADDLSDEEKQRRAIDDQFTLGEDLLVAPMWAGESKRSVVLPAGKWYDFYTGNLVGEGGVIHLEPGLERLPVFVRDGGIVPLTAARRQSPRAGEVLELEVRHYGEKEGAFLLYDDDGVSYDYEKGAFTWTKLGVKPSPTGGWIESAERDAGEGPFGYGPVRWIHMSERASSTASE